MTRASRLEGIVTATPTPLSADGAINGRVVAPLVDRILMAPCAGIAPVGGTGEATALTPAQRREMLELTVAAVNGRAPVIPGILSPGIGEALATADDFAAAGADMLMVVTPYYARATPEGIVDYYKALSDRTDLPLMLYEIPYRTGISLDAQTVEMLAKETRITAMKACNGSLPQQMKVIELAGADIDVLTGEENVFPAHRAIGARGGFLASSCLFPHAWARLQALCSEGRMAEALTFHQKLMPYVSMLYREHNPIPLRAALDLLDLPHGTCLPPLRPASQDTRDMLARELPKALALEADCAPVPAQ